MKFTNLTITLFFFYSTTFYDSFAAAELKTSRQTSENLKHQAIAIIAISIQNCLTATQPTAITPTTPPTQTHQLTPIPTTCPPPPIFTSNKHKITIFKAVNEGYSIQNLRQFILNDAALLNQRPSDLYNILHWIAHYGQGNNPNKKNMISKAQLMLDLKANPNALSKKQKTPLEIAQETNYTALIELLTPLTATPKAALAIFAKPLETSPYYPESLQEVQPILSSSVHSGKKHYLASQPEQSNVCLKKIHQETQSIKHLSYFHTPLHMPEEYNYLQRSDYAFPQQLHALKPHAQEFMLEDKSMQDRESII